MIEEELLKRVVVDPKIMLGKPVIKGTRLTIELIVEKMAMTLGKIIHSLQKKMFVQRFYMLQRD